MALRSVNELDDATDIRIPLDIRGWEVRTTADDEKVGSVHDVLVDERGAARYLDIDLGLLRKHVLLPVGQAVTDATEDAVWVHAMDKDSFNDIPGYDHDTEALSAELEQRLTTSYDDASKARRYERAEYGGSRPPASARSAGQATTRAQTPGGTPDPTVIGTERVRLRRLSELSDYEVADDDPDPRGWDVVGAAGEPLGEVEDLIVDPQALTARYLEVELNDDIIGDREPDRVLVPVGYARIEDDDRVRVDALRADNLRTLPRYSEEFDEAYEERLERHFLEGFRGESRYQHPRYDAERLYGSRDVERTTFTAAGGRLCEVRLRR